MSKCEWIGTKAEGSPVEWHFNPCHWMRDKCTENGHPSNYCASCGADINKPDNSGLLPVDEKGLEKLVKNTIPERSKNLIPGSLNVIMKPSLTEILWRELKKHHKEYCERLSLDPDEYWGKYQIHLIKESQG